MNTEALHQTLQQSFSSDAALRVPAEKTIRNLKHVAGATAMLLQVATEKQVQYEVRQAAAIQLKNLCRQCWNGKSGFGLFTYEENKNDPPVILSDADKANVRVKIVESLLEETEKSVRDLMAEAIHFIAIHDFPDAWSDLLPCLLQTISQGNDPSQALRVHNALIALRKLCKRYEFKSKNERGPLNTIVIQSFPLLLPLAQRLTSPQEHSLEAALMLKQILKIFWSCTQFYLPGDKGAASLSLSNPQSMQPWFDILRVVLAKPLPEASTGLEPLNQPTAVEDRNAWPWWKVKKWSAQIMSRFFSRYGIPSYAEDEHKEFSYFFRETAAVQFLTPVCEVLNLRPSGQFCTDRVLHLCLTFVGLAVELAPTYKMLKPHLDFLLYKVCFPTICLNSDDISLFDNDPHEFVQRQNSPMADYYDPRMAAITLTTDLVKHRGQDVTNALLLFLTEALKRYSASDDATKNHIEKEGALLAIGSLSETLLKKKAFASEIEGLLVTSVFPDFLSPVGFLRSRACWMTQRFSDVTWSDDGTHLRTLIRLVLDRLSDPALPVKIEASKALRFLIQTPGADQTLLPVLPQILEEYFRIMSEIGNEEVVTALRVIIDQFGDHIAPHAVALITKLRTAFATYCDAGDDDDESAMAAGECLECISTVLKGISEKPELYNGIEPLVLPMIKQIIGKEDAYLDFLEQALDMLTFLTFYPETISASLWEVFPMIYIAFDQWAFDYLNLMVPPLENFIGKAPQQFLQGSAVIPQKGAVPYIEMIFAIVDKTVSEEQSSECEVRKALTLYLSILHNCRGQVDKYLPMINQHVLGKLGQQVGAEFPQTRIAIFQVIGSALHYNPLLELAELEKRNVTAQVLTQWSKDSEDMVKWLPQQISVLGLASILQMQTSTMPPSISTAIVTLITFLTKMSEKMKNESYQEPEDEIEDDALGECDDEDFEGFAEDQDVTDTTHEEYMNAIKNMGTNADMRFLIGDWPDDDDDDELYSSPLDDIDQLLFFSDTMRAAFAREPQFYQQIQASLPADVVSSCQKLFAAADLERQKPQDAQVK